MIVGQLEIQMYADIARLRRDMEEVKNTVGGAVSKVTQQAGEMRNIFSNLFRIGGAAGAISLIKELGSELFQAQIRADKLRLGLQFASARPVAEELAFLTSITHKLGLEFISTSQGYMRFAASARGTAIEGEQTRKIFEAVAKAAAVMGLSADEVNGVFRALGQMISKGTVQSEELRGQLSERLPGAFQIFARAMGVSTEQLGKLLEAGKVFSDVELPKFAAQLEKEVGIAAEQAANRAEAALNRLGNAWERFKRASAESTAPVIGGRMNALSNDLTAMSQAMERAQRNGGGFFRQFNDGLGMLIGRAFGLQYINRDFMTLEGAVADATATIARLDEQERRNGGLSIYSMSSRAEAARDLARALRELSEAQNKGTSGNAFRAGDNETMRLLGVQQKAAAELRAKNEQELADIVGKLNGASQDYTKTLTSLSKLRKDGMLDEKSYIELLTKVAQQNYKVAGSHHMAADEEKKRAEEVAKLIEKFKESSEVMRFEADTGSELTSVQKEVFTVMQQLRDGTLKLTDAEKDRLVQQIEAKLEAESEDKLLKDRKKELEEAKKAHEELAKSLAKVEEDQRKFNEDLERGNQHLREQIIVLLEGDEALVVRQREMLLAQIEELEFTKAMGWSNEALEKQAQLLRERVALLDQSVAVKEAKKVRDEWEKTANLIHDRLEDSLMRAFESGHKFFNTLWEEIKNAFKTTVFKLAVNAILQGVGGAIGGPIGQIFTGTATSASSPLTTAANLASVGSFAGRALNPSVSAMASFFGAGQTAGAATGSLTYANTISAMGGNGMDAFLAANANWQGVAAAAGTEAGIAAGAAAGAEAGAASAGSIAAADAVYAGATTTGAAASGAAAEGFFASMGPYGWIALAIIAIAAYFSSGGTPHIGGYALADASGVQDITAQQGGIQSPAMQEVVGGFAKSANELITSTAKTFGEEWRGAVRAVFESDSEDPSWGLFHVLDEFGEKIAGLDALGTLDSDPAKGFQEFVDQSAIAMRDALVAIDLPAWADEALGQIKEGDGMNKLQEVIGQITVIQQAINQFQKGLAPLGGMFTTLSEHSSDAVFDLAELAGGIDNLSSLLSSFTENFYSEAERNEMRVRSVTAAFTNLGVAVPASMEEFRTLVEKAVEDTSEEGQKFFFSLLQIQGAFKEMMAASGQLDETLTETAVSFRELSDEADKVLRKFRSPMENRQADFESVANRLNDIGGNVSVDYLMGLSKEEILEYATAFVKFTDATNEAKMVVVKAADDLLALAQAEEERIAAIDQHALELNIEILRATGREEEALALEREAELIALAATEEALGITDGRLVNLRQTLYEVSDAAEEAAKMQSVLSAAVSTLGEFLTPTEQVDLLAGNIQRTLADAGIEVAIAGIMGSTKDDVVELWGIAKDMGADAMQAVLDAIPAWKQLMELIHGTSNAIQQYREGPLASAITDARLSGMTPQQRVATLKGMETDLFAQIQTSDDPVAVAQKLQDIMLRRLKEEGNLRAVNHDKEKEAIKEQIASLERMRDMAKEIVKFSAELNFGDLSPFNAATQAQFAKDLFGETVTQARGGDEFALQNLTGNARSFLQEAASAFGIGTPQYMAAFNEVQSALQEFKDQVQSDPQLETLKDQLASLESIEEVLDVDILEALQSIDAALAARQAEVGPSTTLPGTGPTEPAAGTGNVGNTQLPPTEEEAATTVAVVEQASDPYVVFLQSMVDNTQGIWDFLVEYPQIDYTECLENIEEQLIGISGTTASSSDRIAFSISSVNDHLQEVNSKLTLIAERVANLEGVKTNTGAIASIEQVGIQESNSRLDSIISRMDAARADAHLESRRPERAT